MRSKQTEWTKDCMVEEGINLGGVGGRSEVDYGQNKFYSCMMFSEINLKC